MKAVYDAAFICAGTIFVSGLAFGYPLPLVLLGAATPFVALAAERLIARL